MAKADAIHPACGMVRRGSRISPAIMPVSSSPLIAYAIVAQKLIVAQSHLGRTCIGVAAPPMHVLPRWDWATINFWATIAYAMSGLELTGMMAGEIRDPRRTIPQAGWIASAFAIVFYSSTTIALLALLRPERISDM